MYYLEKFEYELGAWNMTMLKIIFISCFNT